MKTPITYYGGKQSLVKHLLPLIPSHKIYCEPFFGGGALLFAKEPSEVEVINDINSEVVNFFKVAKTNFSELQKEVIGTPHSREAYSRAKAVYQWTDMFSEVKRAWAFWVLTNQGFAGSVDSWGFGKENSKEKALANKRNNFLEHYAKRLDAVQIENHDAIKVIERCDTKDTFFYCDPPYINSDMGHYSDYNETDYRNLLDCLVKVKGKFLLSSYPNKILSEYIKKYKWNTKQVQKTVYVTKLTNKHKTELMVFNYDEPEFDAVGSLNRINAIFNGSDVSNENNSETLNDYTAELMFMKAFVDFDNKLLSADVLKKFIDDLQQAISNKVITKTSPFAKEVMFIQSSVIRVFNAMTKPLTITLKPSTLKRINTAIEKASYLNTAFLQNLTRDLESLNSELVK